MAQAESGRLSVLDGVRGVAILAVVALHSGILPLGWLGVDLFFVLSGFLITGILLTAKEKSGDGWVCMKVFYVRRSLRIFPLAFLVLGGVFFVAPLLGIYDPAPFREQLLYWLYVSNWSWASGRSEAASAVFHFWSLGVEEQFYLCWPWVVLFVSRKKLWRVCAGLLGVALIFRIIVVLLLGLPSGGHFYHIITVARMDGLVIGALLAILHSTEGGLKLWRREAGWIFGIGLLVVGMVALPIVPEAVNYILIYPAFSFSVAGAITLLLTDSQGRMTRILSVSWLRWIGTVSYGVYVLHSPLVNRLHEHGVSGVSNFLIALPVTLALAAVSWYFFESPILSFKKYWPMPEKPLAGAQQYPQPSYVVFS